MHVILCYVYLSSALLSNSNIDYWIRSKYETKKWAQKGPIPDPESLGDGFSVQQEKVLFDRTFNWLLTDLILSNRVIHNVYRSVILIHSLITYRHLPTKNQNIPNNNLNNNLNNNSSSSSKNNRNNKFLNHLLLLLHQIFSTFSLHHHPLPFQL